jgi:predicted dehydrogenase
MRIGVVGYGSIGQRHAANAKKLGHETIVYDPMLQHNDVKFEREVYETCDAVVIATPSWVHTGCIRACAERGRHMLVEKPISTTDKGLQELLDFAEKSGAVVMMGNNLRFHPCVQQAAECMRRRYVGNPLWASFTCAAKSIKAPYLSDGVILNTGSHEVDLALHLLGPARVVYAQARFKRHNAPDADDIADFMLYHENDCRSVFHIDFVTETEIREFRIIGTEGDLFCDLPARTLRGRQPDDKLPGVTHVKNFDGPGSYDTDYVDEMRAFIDRIEGKTVDGASGHQGLHALQILLDVRKKAGL